MTHEELIKIANANYPIGTEYYPLNSVGNEYRSNIKENSIRPAKFVYKDDIPEKSRLDVGSGYIYAGGNWAKKHIKGKVVDGPLTPEIVNNYEIY